MYKTPKYIIDEINHNIDEEKRILLAIYSYFIRICHQEMMAYTSALDDLYMEYKLKALLNQEWGTNILSETSFNRLNQFEREWIKYRKVNSFSEDEFFVYIDSQWHQLVETHLIPCIESLEIDFGNHTLSNISCKKK